MKKTLVILLVLALILSFSLALSACGNDDDKTTAGNVSSENANVTEAPSETEKKEAETTEAPKTEAPVTTEAPAVTGGYLTFSNPNETIRSTDWDDYGCGDPYVMRFNGKYYLYCSTRDGSIGVMCWSSDDMVNWTLEGKCAKERVTGGAYAPEVYYADGKFYMYSSPRGNGHYVFESDSPTGPFTVVTENIGLSIDGSVFIDDNGNWYFYHAGGGGIEYNKMISPTEINPNSTRTASYMNGWTEGSMIVKHDGTYFMTYTGNHVLNNAYRIDYSYSKNSPINFTKDDSNPLLISTEDGVVGIGHSSTVKGPDLDSYYIVYHVLVGRSKMLAAGAPDRECYFDRIVFNGTTMEILGPTTEEQIVYMPYIYTHFNDDFAPSTWEIVCGEIKDGFLKLSGGGKMLSKVPLSDIFTAEFNLRSSGKAGEYGAYFSYTDENNYGKIGFNLDEGKVKVTLCVSGNITTETYNMPKNCGKPIDTSALQAFQVERNNNKFTFYFNDRLLGSLESTLEGGKIGYYADNCDAEFGFIGGSDKVGGNSDGNDAKNIPGMIESISAIEKIDSSVISGTRDRGFKYIDSFKKGEKYTYSVYPAKEGKYDFSINYSAKEDSSIMIYYNGKALLDSPLSLEKSDSFVSAIARGIVIDKKGIGEFAIEVISGEIGFMKFNLASHTDIEGLTIDYSKSDSSLVRYTTNSFSVKNGVLSNTGAFAKRTYGDSSWGDYTVEADITFTQNINGGIIFRVHNPGTGGHFDSVDDAMGTDYLQGYFAGISSTGVVLGKQNYSWVALKSYNATMETGKTYNLKVEAYGANIKVYLDGKLVIDYTDPDPYITGSAGFRCHDSLATFDNFKVSVK